MLRNHLLFGRGFAFVLVAVVGLSTQVFSSPTQPEHFGSPISYDWSPPSPSSPGSRSQEAQLLHVWGPASTSSSHLPDKVPVNPQGMLASRKLHKSQPLDELHDPILGQQRTLIASQSAPLYSGSATGSYQGLKPLVPSTGTFRPESSRRTRVPLKQPKVPKQPKAYEQTQTTAEKWLNTMRRALGNPDLEFTSLEGWSGHQSRLFVAEDATREDDHHPYTARLQNPSSNSDGKVHFVRRLAELRKVALMKLENPKPRSFIYLNSRSNMNYLNKEYFLNRLHFFPINPKNLRWEALNGMLKQREHLIGLPPRTEHGLPLLMARHQEKTDAMKRIQMFTGAFKDQAQIVSLWSPMLHTEGHTTMVLYGIGQLDRGDFSPTNAYPNGLRDVDTLLHLSRLNREGEDKELRGDYYFKDHFPGGLTAKAIEVLESSKLGVK